MTIQKRTLISPSDIVGIEYECKHCHARWSVPLKRTDRTIFTCPNCQENWIGAATPMTSDYSDEKALSYFIRFLADIQARSLGVIVRFELATIDEATQNAATIRM